MESVGEILDGFEANVFESNEEKVKILEDRHKTFENTTDIPEEGSSKAKRGPRGTKFAKKCKARSQARYKRRNGIIKSIRDLKVVTADHSLTIFFKHPVDSSSSTESSMFATTRELIEKYKDAPFNSTMNESSTNRIFDEAPSNQELRMATPSKKSKNTNKKRKRIREDEKIFCRVCDVKHNSKVDIDYGSPWIGCEVTKCDYWVHVFCLGFTTEDPEGLGEWFCKNHHPIKKPNHRRIVKKVK